MSNRAGKDHKIYISTSLLTDTAGAGAVWVEFAPVESTDSEIAREEVTFKTRENGGAEQTLGGTISNTIDINWAYLSGDANADAILAAIVADNLIAIADVDGDISTSGTKGQIGNYSVLSFSQSKPIDDVVTVTASCKLADANFNLEYSVA